MKILRLIFVIVFFLLLVIIGLFWKYEYTLRFDNIPDSILTVNGDEVVPKFSKEVKDYHSISLSAITPNLMKFGNITKKFNVKEINPNSPVIPFKIGNETYNLHVWSDNLSEFETEGAENVTDGQYFITSQWWDINHTFPAYIVNKYGKILYYRYAYKNGNLKSTSDFKCTILPDNTKVYSLIEDRTLLLMDSDFYPFFRTNLLPNSNHGELLLDGHHHLILGKNHFITYATIMKEFLDSKKEIPVFLAVPLIQEIAEGKVIFEWDGINYPELFKNYFQCKKKYNGAYDYAHLNTIIIDPKDNNLILSFRNQNELLKIDRIKGNVIWKLSGINDEFDLKKEQKFYGQHFPYITKTGDLVIFDNHINMMHETDFTKENSSIKKFKLDEKNKKIVDFKKVPLSFQSAGMGSSIQLDKNYIVSAGSVNKDNFCGLEVSENGNELWKLKFKDESKRRCYYIYKRPFWYK